MAFNSGVASRGTAMGLRDARNLSLDGPQKDLELESTRPAVATEVVTNPGPDAIYHERSSYRRL